MSLCYLKRIASLLTGLFVFLCIVYTRPANAFVNEQGVVTAIPSDIAIMFPSATRIGSPQLKQRVIPVYQLNELLGYVFESDDFTNIVGFSGQTINLLIAIDPQGILIKVKVLNHHEPIFMHGLGERPMISFIKQFEGHSIKERFIVDARDRRNKSVTHIDGVTKATVSALVINDTIISSAISVAREMLDGFAPLSNMVLKDNYLKPMTFDELVTLGYIKHWRLTYLATIEKFPFLTDRLQTYQDQANLIDLYIAPLSIEMVGKNLLGLDEYARLLENIGPDSSAFMVLDNGAYPFVTNEFVPQTAPERFKIIQSGLPQDIRDIDFYSFSDPQFALKMPLYKQLLVLNVKGKSGFDLASEFEYHLSIDYNISFLTRESHNLSAKVALPVDLFEVNKALEEKKRLPLWQRIWLDRLATITIVGIYLAMVVLLFCSPNRGSELMVNKRGQPNYFRLASLLFCLLFIGLYSQGQLSVVNIYTLLLSLSSGFDITVFLLDPVLFILWSVLFVSLFLWGRGLFCGWLCPFGALQELMSYIANKLSIRQWRIASQTHAKARLLKYAILIGLIASAFYSLTLAEQLAEVEPFKTAITMNFVRSWPFVLYAAVLVALSLKVSKFYCRYLCPLGAGLAILGAFPLLRWIKRRPECGNPCQLCNTKKCTINAIEQSGQVNYRECVGCFDCVVTINQPTQCVIDKYAKKRRP